MASSNQAKIVTGLLSMSLLSSGASAGKCRSDVVLGFPEADNRNIDVELESSLI